MRRSNRETVLTAIASTRQHRAFRLEPFLCTERAPAASLNGSDAMADPTPPPIPSDAPAGGRVLDGDDEGNLRWVWEPDADSLLMWQQDGHDPTVLSVLAEIDAQTAALEADARARRQVCRRTHGAQFSETLGIVALAMTARGQ